MKKFIVAEENLRQKPDGTVSIVGPVESYVPPEYLAIGPMDGRYRDTGEKLSPYFSEFALVKNRVKVEVLWLQFLLDNLRGKSRILATAYSKFDATPNFIHLFEQFSYEDFFEVKKIEAETNHDVKSVELWVAQKVEEMGYPELRSFVHIGCTSEDITNPSYARMIRDAIEDVWYPKAEELIEMLEKMAEETKGIPMLAYTHGQPATPTTVGKEIFNTAYRLRQKMMQVSNMETMAKFNGATGNYAAISIAFPGEDWPCLARQFVKRYLDLDFNPVTTQIEPHDYIVEIAGYISHFNRICANLCMNMWIYISKEFFVQIPVKKEVGSSTMPNKVNPINFENGEANFRKSTADFEFLSEWLMSSRMQRDLRDSTLLRNLGTAFAHSLLGIERTIKGLKKVKVNEKVLKENLDGKWEVLAEAVQTVLRKHGIPDAYNRLKELTRGKNITKEALHEFIKSLDEIPECEREALLNMKPEDYTGFAEEIVEREI